MKLDDLYARLPVKEDVRPHICGGAIIELEPRKIAGFLPSPAADAGKGTATIEVVDDDDDDMDEELKDAIDILKRAYNFMDKLIGEYLIDHVTMGKDTLIDLELTANEVHEFINEYEPFRANSKTGAPV